MMTDALQEAGARILGSLGQLGETLAFVRRHGAEISGAVLDLNLHGQSTYHVADALSEAGVRFVFVTGYDTGAIESRLSRLPSLRKAIPARGHHRRLGSALVS